jgi:hypothetical protein
VTPPAGRRYQIGGAEAAAHPTGAGTSSFAAIPVSSRQTFCPNLTERYGPEFSKPERGGYDLDYVPLRDDSLGAIDLKPAVLKEFVLANRDALLAEAGFRA